MEKDLLSLEQIIEKAKELGVEFGKGDPYNRLRYYTKIGWLPHMERKLDEETESSVTRGHYPKWVLKRLLLIENLKKKGLTNEQVAKKLETTNKIQAITDYLKAPQTRQKIATYASLIILLIIMANELDIIKLGKSKSSFNLQTEPEITASIIDSGQNIFPSQQQKIFIDSANITDASKVTVTFRQDYSPAVKYWVSKVVNQQGFELTIDVPLQTPVMFDWIVSK
jgi:hypothetical protein